MNYNKNIRTVSSNKPVNSEIVRPVDNRKPVCPVNFSKPVLPIDVRESARPVNSNKPVYLVDVCKFGGPVDVRKPVCLVDIRKHFFFRLLETCYSVFDFIVFCSFHKYWCI